MPALDEKYAREMAKELPLRTVLRFFQIARQVDRLVSLKIMSDIPLVPTEAHKAKAKTKRNLIPKRAENPDAGCLWESGPMAALKVRGRAAH